MGLIREPLTVDFYFDERHMTDADHKRVSDFIANSQRLKTKAVTESKYAVTGETTNMVHEGAEQYVGGKDTTAKSSRKK